MTPITPEQLQAIFARIVDKLAKEAPRPLDLSSIDYYKFIPTDEWQDLESETDLHVGSLADDWQGLEQAMERDTPLSVVDIERFAFILRAISQKLSE